MSEIVVEVGTQAVVVEVSDVPITLDVTDPQVVVEVQEIPLVLDVTPQVLEVEVGQVGIPGATGPTGADADYSIQTDDTVTIGQPLYLKSPGGTLGLAQADGIPQARVFGLALQNIVATVAVLVRTIGRVELADWTGVTGAASLVRGDVYYLDPATPGMLTTTAPAAGGDLVTRVGTAATATILDLHIMRPIQKV